MQLAEAQGQAAVTLEFTTPKDQITFAPHTGAPAKGQTLHVNGVERHYWVEFTAPLRRRPDLRNVAGRDLRRKEVAVITTDDGRRYAFLTNPDLPAEVIESIPPGRRGTLPAAKCH